MIRAVLKIAAISIGGLVGILTILAWAMPVFLIWLEEISHMPIPYEGVLRLYLLGAFGIGFLIYTVWLVRHRTTINSWLWQVLLFWLIGFAIVAFGDNNHRLMEEYSWVRYSTAVFLFLTAAVAAKLAWHLYSRHKRGQFLIWTAVSGVFIFATADELGQLHEAVAWHIERALGKLVQAGDFITLGYAIVGGLVVGLVWWRARELMRSWPKLATVVLWLGVITYLFSTLLDTLDIVMQRWLHELAINILKNNPTHTFGEAWYVLWPVKNFTNGLEEVLEYLAAALFFSVVYMVAYQQDSSNNLLPTSQRWVVRTNIILSMISGAIITMLILSAPLTLATNPVRDSTPVTTISRPIDGLIHSDDITFHSQWGVIVANEGGRNVRQWQANSSRALPDPNKLLIDPDSVTANDKAIYISDSTKGIIFRYTEQNGLAPQWTRHDGLYEPEGLIVVGNELYVVDESQLSITKLVLGKAPVVWYPKHELWSSPEGITYDPLTKRLIITDDVSGAVFAVDFGHSINLLTRLTKPEDVVVLSDGRLLVTDTARGAVIVIGLDGTTYSVVTFLRTYRDLVGLAVDGQDNIFVVASDGFGSVSFMPSLLFKLNTSKLR